MIVPFIFLSTVKSHLQASDIDAKVAKLVSQMTLDEKLSYIGGYGFDVEPIPRLGIPELVMSDGPVGLRNAGPATAYPAGVMLAASFDSALALRYGKSIGDDARARGVNFWLGPGVNLDRIPQNGRNFEYLGEDPILSGTLAAEIVSGAQSKEVCPTVKHFTANDNEVERGRDSSDVDERTLHEVTMRPFEYAVKMGHAMAIMNSYNLVNGTYMSENARLIKVLKQDWKFPGVLMSDWGSTHSVNVYNAGLDLEMPGGYEMSPAILKPLIESGKLSTKPLDDKVTRILRVAETFHWLDRPQKDISLPYINPHSDETALKIAEEGITLLRNQNDALPLNPNSRGEILVIGPNAQPPVTGGGGSSYVQPHASIGLADAMHKVAPSEHIVQLNTTQTSEYDLTNMIKSDQGNGFKEEIFNNQHLQGTPVVVQLDPRLQHDWTKNSPNDSVGHDHYSVRWTGTYTPQSTGSFQVYGQSDDGMRVWVNDKKVIGMWNDQAKTSAKATVNLTAGKSYELRIEYYQDAGDASVNFNIQPLNQFLDKALPISRIQKAKTIIAYVGFNPDTESEGIDRSWQLPSQQQILLNRACKYNKNVILVVNAGGAVDLNPWKNKVSAIIDAYYPGENGDLALAKILFGQINPSGHLPFTMPTHLADLLSTGTYPAKNHQVYYKEGVFIGQRGLDKQGIKAMFPFGYGLSFIKFVATASPPLLSKDRLIANGSVKNIGAKAGAEVIQAYIGYPHGPVERPIHELKGFARVQVPTHQTRKFGVEIDFSDLGFWDVHRHNWTVTPGIYTLYLGTSSQDFFATKQFRISVQEAQDLNQHAQP